MTWGGIYSKMPFPKQIKGSPNLESTTKTKSITKIIYHYVEGGGGKINAGCV